MIWSSDRGERVSSFVLLFYLCSFDVYMFNSSVVYISFVRGERVFFRPRAGHGCEGDGVRGGAGTVAVGPGFGFWRLSGAAAGSKVLNNSLCLYKYVYIYIYIYIYILMCMYIYIYIYVHTYIHTYACVCILLYIYI